MNRCSPPWSGSTTSSWCLTADAVLVASRPKAEQVKALVVQELKMHNYRAAVEHGHHRPWAITRKEAWCFPQSFAVRRETGNE